VSIIAPVFRLIEIVPGYRELDISPVFLLALSLFFGMIIGDAGYGALYIALTFFAQKKLGARVKDHTVFSLLYLFSASAVLWGVLTGTVFGQEWYLKAGFKPAVPILTDTKFLQAFCFFLGAVHLSIAQGWQAIRKIPSLTILADVGWIGVIWAAFFLACMLILGETLPACTKWLMIGGIALVIVGTAPQRNIFKMVGSGLGNVALSIMNNFTDVVSYIRLFAVGLAGVAIADTVNTLAAEVGNPVAQVLILFAGHTINIILGPMSVLVHGVRLNVLEFSGHAGLTWSGTRYKPLEE
jgi:V/A-type H+-transporting ATPase subunit I